MEMTTREFLKVSGGAALSGASLGTFGAEPRRKVRIGLYRCGATGAERPFDLFESEARGDSLHG